ncbi:MAG TPA: sigma-70 family RNA polymerase sigma factor [Myxococcales bacterium]
MSGEIGGALERAFSEGDLALACARGEGRAWAELLRRYDGKVRGALRVAGALEDAEDLRQDVWVRLLANDRAALRRFRGERAGSLPMFIGQVARRVAIDHGRARRLRPPGSGGAEATALPSSAPGPFEQLRGAVRVRRLSAALDAVAAVSGHPARDRDILRLHFEEGWLPAEIAGITPGISARGIESLLRRTRAKLAEVLSDEA